MEEICSALCDSSELLMEFVELKSSDELSREFCQNNEINFWKLVNHLPKLAKLARRFLSMFLSTYRCEACFSALSRIESSRRNHLTRQHTKECLRISVSSIEPNFIAFVSEKERHISTSN
ncbi:UNVERIFIED_CONTAM: hypothetical protein FKN15_040625 [Acipenser sinensis]